jgi:hypothetical protein
LLTVTARIRATRWVAMTVYAAKNAKKRNTAVDNVTTPV